MRDMQEQDAKGQIPVGKEAEDLAHQQFGHGYAPAFKDPLSEFENLTDAQMSSEFVCVHLRHRFETVMEFKIEPVLDVLSWHPNVFARYM